MQLSHLEIDLYCRDSLLPFAQKGNGAQPKVSSTLRAVPSVSLLGPPGVLGLV